MNRTPHALVEPQWLEDHLDDPNLRVVALNWTGGEDFARGHIPTAQFWDWKAMLWDPLKRDFPTPQAFAERCAAAGIGNHTKVVFYGDPALQFGTYAWWVFRLCGHPDARVLNGGRRRWEAEGRRLTTELAAIRPMTYTPVARPDEQATRATRDDVLASLDRGDTVLLDHRSPEEYSGERVSPPNSPDHGAERTGRIPGARPLHFEELLAADGSFRPADELRRLFVEQGATPDKRIISYCRLSHRATLACFAMTQILGYPDVRSYDGSWTEWGSLVGVPIER
ncbi:MAG: sulfurtransferase [Alphaproteobacteria bacterium]